MTWSNVEGTKLAELRNDSNIILKLATPIESGVLPTADTCHDLALANAMVTSFIHCRVVISRELTPQLYSILAANAETIVQLHVQSCRKRISNSVWQLNN